MSAETGFPAGRERRGLVVDGERRRPAGLELTPAKTSRKPSRASAGRMWSCGPTDTPPVVMSMSTSRSAARMTATVASRSSPTRTRVTRSPPARCTAPPSAGPLESRMPPGGSGLPGSVSSSPVPISETRGRRTTHGRGMFSEASTPSSAGPSSEPAWMTSDPATMSSPAGRRCMPWRIVPSTTTAPSSIVTSSCWAIGSAPSGTGAPVEIRTVVPGRTRRRRRCRPSPRRSTRSRRAMGGAAATIA